MAKLSELQDNFDDNSFNTGKFDRYDAAHVVEQNGRLEMSSILAGDYFICYSIATYDMTDSGVFLQLVDAGNQSLPSWEIYPIVLFKDIDNYVEWAMIGDIFYVFKHVAGSGSTQGSPLAYNSAVHKWLRIRETAGTMYFDWSTDGTNWTTHTSLATPFDVTSMEFNITVGTYDSEATTTTMIIDNLNIIKGGFIQMFD